MLPGELTQLVLCRVGARYYCWEAFNFTSIGAEVGLVRGIPISYISCPSLQEFYEIGKYFVRSFDRCFQ